jgi:predicted RNase H-like HicB family nuclease
MPRTDKSPAAYTVNCRWDEEARVWYVADSNVPGLATGADTLDELLGKLQTLIPELLELNEVMPTTPEINLVVHAATRTQHAA